jgi:DNA-binding CsgD family transcriptional regulator
VTVANSLAVLYRGWVAHREAQVADLLAAGISDPGQVAARLDMTLDAARAYLVRANHGQAAARGDRFIAPRDRANGHPWQPAHDGVAPGSFLLGNAAGAGSPPPPGRP